MQRWLDRAFTTERKHKELLRNNFNHRVEDTANKLGYSVGFICEDLMIAHFFRLYEDEIVKLESKAAALRFIRAKKMELKLKMFDISEG